MNTSLTLRFYLYLRKARLQRWSTITYNFGASSCNFQRTSSRRTSRKKLSSHPLTTASWNSMLWGKHKLIKVYLDASASFSLELKTAKLFKSLQFSLPPSTSQPKSQLAFHITLSWHSLPSSLSHLHLFPSQTLLIQVFADNQQLHLDLRGSDK